MSLLSKGVRELRFIMCQQNANSAGVRAFVLNNYQSVKASNPEFPFIVREANLTHQQAKAGFLAMLPLWIIKVYWLAIVLLLIGIIMKVSLGVTL